MLYLSQYSRMTQYNIQDYDVIPYVQLPHVERQLLFRKNKIEILYLYSIRQLIDALFNDINLTNNQQNSLDRLAELYEGRYPQLCDLSYQQVLDLRASFYQNMRIPEDTLPYISYEQQNELYELLQLFDQLLLVWIGIVINDVIIYVNRNANVRNFIREIENARPIIPRDRFRFPRSFATINDTTLTFRQKIAYDYLNQMYNIQFTLANVPIDRGLLEEYSGQYLQDIIKEFH
jgi:hypothetical protein